MHRMIEGKAGALRICDGGEGNQPLIFAHALGARHEHWEPALRRVRRSDRAIAFDLRGHGESAPPRDGDWSVQGYGDDLLAALDACGIERAVFVGNSLGAMAAIAAADRAPTRCAGLFLVDPGSDPSTFPQELAAQLLGAMEADFEAIAAERHEQLLAGAREKTRSLVLPTLQANEPATIIGTLRRLGDFHAVEALRRWQGPIFVLAGPMGSEDDALQRVLGLPRRELEGVSHFVHLDAPEVFHEELDRFLAGIPV